jgi:hypothetical protein
VKSNWRQAFAAHATAVGQRGLAALGGITVQKPVLALAADFRRLILAFHKLKISRALGGMTPVDGAGEVSNEPPSVKTRNLVKSRVELSAVRLYYPALTNPKHNHAHRR